MSKHSETEHDHRALAVSLFNLVWTLMETANRTTLQTDEMIHAAHASRYHWSLVGTPVNLVRGEWQVSRVYSVAMRPEPATFHARRCLDLCTEHNICDFDLAYAYEALARASAVRGDLEEAKEFAELAFEAALNIADKDDRDHFYEDMETLPGIPLEWLKNCRSRHDLDS